LSKAAKQAASVDAFIAQVPDPVRKADAAELIGMLRKVSGVEPAMWGTSMVGFGNFHYRYDSGREGDTFVVGFSPRKDAITLYLSCDATAYAKSLGKLGKHKAGKGCIYIRQLDDVDRRALEALLAEAWASRAEATP
jgi:hypothetical protein